MKYRKKHVIIIKYFAIKELYPIFNPFIAVVQKGKKKPRLIHKNKIFDYFKSLILNKYRVDKVDMPNGYVWYVFVKDIYK